MKSARAVRKLKEIQHVKAAIRYSERARERKIALSEQRSDTKAYVKSLLERQQYSAVNVRTARKNAREDWKLGPLRPNRAYGVSADNYGVMHYEEVRGSNLPEHLFNAGDKQRRVPSMIPKEYLHDMWPIVEGDRVVIMSGKDRGRVGIVEDVAKNTFEITVKDLNKIWMDGRLRHYAPGEEFQAKQDVSGALRYDQVRLVAPQYINVLGPNGRTVRMLQDVIVDGIETKRHTEGFNPFTGQYEIGIPEEEQIDPETEQVVYHRYIAGTRERLKWPWELEAERDKAAQDSVSAKKGAINDKEDEASPSVLDKFRSGISRVLNRKKAEVASEAKAREEEISSAVEETTEQKQFTARPRERDPPVHDGDTLRNIVEGQISWVPSLVTPPFPESVVSELRAERKEREELDKEAENYKELVKERRTKIVEAKIKAQQEKEAQTTSMKTPLRIKWELEQAAKKHKPQQYHPTGAPRVPTYLLQALGKHMAKNGRQPKQQ